MPDSSAPQFLTAPGFNGSTSEKLAYRRAAGDGPAVVWCGGLKSDMNGTKATALEDWAREQCRAFVRFDYFGHGASSGQFGDGTISRWARDTVQVIDALTSGDVVLVGSSMGGWTSLLAAQTRMDRVKGLVLIAPAPDFTEDLWNSWPESIQREVMQKGRYFAPSGYDEPYEYSKALIVDGRDNLLLGRKYDFDGPVSILQGGQDAVVSASHAQKIYDWLPGADVTLTMVKNGDHSLSQPRDLSLLIHTVESMIEQVSAS